MTHPIEPKPTTEAGRRLLASSCMLGPGEPLMADTILAIETEAAAAALPARPENPESEENPR